MKNKGFTLIELIVGMGIFVIIISVVLSLFMSALTGQRKILAQQNLQDNARYLLGFIAKELRMSDIKSVSTNTLVIERHDGTEVTYTFDNSEKQIERNDGLTSGPINSDQVLVTGRFYGSGIAPSDDIQPRITIVLKLETINNKPEERVELNIQVTLSQRNLGS